MVADGKHYADLPHEVRAFLETLDGEGVTNLADMMRTYRELSTPRAGKISPMDFLINAKPRALEWMRDVREDEIDQLDEAITLVRSGRTVGRFMKWAIITLIGAFFIMSQLGDAVSRILALLRGAPK